VLVAAGTGFVTAVAAMLSGWLSCSASAAVESDGGLKPLLYLEGACFLSNSSFER
jgi:hypothetical protein